MQPSVLLADDDEGAREIYGSFFSRAGWNFDVVPDGISAIDAASKKEYDVVLTDLMMPGAHGYEVLRILKQYRPNQAIIVVTASTNVQDVIDSLREGASDILVKPIDFETLRRSVERLVHSMKRLEGDEKSIYQHVREERTVYEFKAKEVASLRFSVGLIDRLCKSGSIDRLTKLKMHLSVQEALTNSLDHGALELDSIWKEELDEEGLDRFSKMKTERLKDKQYSNRSISVTVLCENKQLSIKIRDTGPGFVRSDTAAARHDEGKVIKSSGRGLGIIRGTMDEVIHSDGGREITMIKYLGKRNGSKV